MVNCHCSNIGAGRMLCTEISLLCSGAWIAGEFCAHVHDCTEKQLLTGPREGKVHLLTLFPLCKEPITDCKVFSLDFIAY